MKIDPNDLEVVFASLPTFGSVAKFYGDIPYKSDPDRLGMIVVDPAWLEERTVVLSADEDLPGFPGFQGQQVSGVRLHRLIAPLFKAAWAELVTLGLHVRLRSYDGAFMARHKLFDINRALSLHAYGAAIDFDARWNGYGLPIQQAGIDRDVVRVFERFGFSWGGRWRIPDAMHFEAVKPRPGALWDIRPFHERVPPPFASGYNRKVIVLRDREVLEVHTLPDSYHVVTRSDFEGNFWIDMRSPELDGHEEPRS